MAYAFVNDVQGSVAGATSTTIVSPAMNVTVGNTLLVAVTYNNATQQSVTMSDSATGNTYVPLRTYYSNPVGLAFFYVLDASLTASTTFTATFGATSSFRGIYVAQYSGLGAFLTQTGQPEVNPGTGTDAYTSGTVNDSNVPAMAWGFVAPVANFNLQPSAGTNYTGRTPSWNLGTGTAFALAEDRRITTPGNIAATYTIAEASTRYVFVAIFPENLQLAANDRLSQRYIGPAEFNLPPRCTDNAVSTLQQPPQTPALPPGPGVQPQARLQFFTPPRSTASTTTAAPIGGVAASHSVFYAPLGLAIKNLGFIPQGGPGVAPFSNNQFLQSPGSTTNPVNAPTFISGISVSQSMAYASMFGTGVVASAISISGSVVFGLGQPQTAGSTTTGLAASASLVYASSVSLGLMNATAISQSDCQTITSGGLIQPLVPMTSVTDVRLRIGYQPWRVNRDDVIG